ncbi:hypothetical protein [Nocardia pseudobrasiliensis]|uniref:Uncharacterized protein n=1 Tax=Nocardia pseudobrasiliensis TaxID=45979 RepID=A0A370HW07_9NOCA|nr:hypothetical protein [Nocardia pseudobrasiliensis]RDI62693.1 hypothetical protein DFR76_11210 [Nocardia pseudobrasiliensis]
MSGQLRRALRIALWHVMNGLRSIAWGYHIDASMVAAQRRDGRLSASEREAWRALEKSLRNTESGMP